MSNMCWAQHTQMLSEYNYWEYYSNYGTKENNNCGTIYDVDGTVSVKGKTYYKVRIFHDYFDSGNGNMACKRMNDSNDESTSLYVLLREDNGKVYANGDSYGAFVSDNPIFNADEPYFSDSDGDHLLYDFTLGVGDTYPMNGDVHVEEISTIVTHDGIGRKVLHLSNGMNIIEGIGCQNSIGELLGYQSSVATHNENESIVGSLVLFELGTNLIYDGRLTSIEQISDKVRCSSVYDMCGRAIVASNALRNGIYIRNGKKLVQSGK